MSEPVRDSFCPIYFADNGGQFDELGKPIISEDTWIRGMCNRPWDCGACSHMRRWIEHLEGQGWQIGWECKDCIGGFPNDPLRCDPDTETVLPGHYQSAWPDDRDNLHMKHPIDGCTRCGFNETSLLQLVLRRPRRGGL